MSIVYYPNYMTSCTLLLGKSKEVLLHQTDAIKMRSRIWCM